MWTNWRQREHPIGCEISAQAIRLAQFGRDPAQVILRSCPLPPSNGASEAECREAIVQAIRGMLQDGEFRGRRIVSSLATDQLSFRLLRFAPMPDADLRSAIEWKLASELKLNRDQFQAAILTEMPVTESGGVKVEIMAVSAPRATVMRQVEVITRAGATLDAVDASVCAMARVLERLQRPGVAVMLAERGTLLAVLDKGDVRFTRSCEGGWTQLVDTLARRLDIDREKARAIARGAGNATDDPAQSGAAPEGVHAALVDASQMFARELAREVLLAMRYYEEKLGGTSPTCGWLLGPCQLPAEAIAALAVQSGIRFETAPSLESLGLEVAGEVAAEEPGAWLTAIGLSLYDGAIGVSEEAA